MVIRGRTRGNGSQLSKYLLTIGENEDIRILDVNGRPDPQDVHLHQALLSMSLTSELTKSDKGLYHAQINPAYGEDQAMTPDTWHQAADMLGAELGLKEQRRVIVLHTKKGRTHAHVVWERYDMQKGIMISDSFSRLAQDRVRKEMERVFEQKKTPHRNVQRPFIKDTLTRLWQITQTSADFIKKAKEAGYVIAKGIQRRPFMVVDETGRSFDLVRQLDGTKTKEVRDRLEKAKLPPEKEAITLAKGQKSTKSIDTMQEKASDKIEAFQEQQKVKQEQLRKDHVQAFLLGKQDIIKPDEQKNKREKQRDKGKKFFAEKNEITKTPEKQKEPQKEPQQPTPQPEPIAATQQEINTAKATLFAESKPEMIKPQPEQPTPQEVNLEKASQFADNKPDITPLVTEKELARQKMLQTLKEQRERNSRNKDKGHERD